MRVKTSNLNGLALNYAVALCEGGEGFVFDGITWGFVLNGKIRVLSKGWARSMSYCPGEEWGIAGPIIEREKIEVTAWGHNAWRARSNWNAIYETWVHVTMFETFGPIPLIASMRCYVASKLGDTIELPSGMS